MEQAREAIHCGEAWNMGYTGKGVGVAVLDTGIFPHEEMCIRDRDLYNETEEQDINTLKEKGVQVVEVDREPFREIGETVVEKYCNDYPQFQEMLNKLREMGAK